VSCCLGQTIFSLLSRHRVRAGTLCAATLTIGHLVAVSSPGRTAWVVQLLGSYDLGTLQPSTCGASYGCMLAASSPSKVVPGSLVVSTTTTLPLFRVMVDAPAGSYSVGLMLMSDPCSLSSSPLVMTVAVESALPTVRGGGGAVIHKSQR